MAQVDDTKQSQILMSIKPAFSRMILEGSKTIELRRRFSEKIEVGTKIIIYATDPVKAIVGECTIKEVLKLSLPELWARANREAMIDWKTFKSYFSGVEFGYGIVVHKTLMYEESIPLAFLRSKHIAIPQSYRAIEAGL